MAMEVMVVVVVICSEGEGGWMGGWVGVAGVVGGGVWF